MNAVVIGQRYTPTIVSPAATTPQVVTNNTGYGQASAAAQPALITFSWSILVSAAALLVLYFKVVK